MNSLFSWLKKLSPAKQFMLATTIYSWSIYIFDTFYMTTVFKESGETSEVVINIIVTLLTVFIGYVIGSIYMKKVGVEVNLKLGYALYLFTGIAGILLTHFGLASFVVISVFRGIAEGFYWASINFIELVGIHEDSRGKIYSVAHGLNGLFNMIAPVTLGYLLTTFNSYIPVYVLFCILWIVGLFIPFDFQVNGKISLSWKKFQELLKRPKLGTYTLLRIDNSFMWMWDWFNYALIPFILLGDILNMGVYLTIAATVNIVVSILTRDVKFKYKTEWGLGLLLVSMTSVVLFAFNFNPLFLYISGIVGTITNSIIYPAELDLGVRVTNYIEGGKGVGNELNLYQETVYTVVRVILAGILIIGGKILNTTLLLQAGLLAVVVLKLVNYLVSMKFLANNKDNTGNKTNEAVILD